MSNWPYPLPPLKGTPPHPHRPEGRAGYPPTGGGDRYGTLPPACLALEIVVEENEPVEEDAEEQEAMDRVCWPWTSCVLCW